MINIAVIHFALLFPRKMNRYAFVVFIVHADFAQRVEAYSAEKLTPE